MPPKGGNVSEVAYKRKEGRLLFTIPLDLRTEVPEYEQTDESDENQDQEPKPKPKQKTLEEIFLEFLDELYRLLAEHAYWLEWYNILFDETSFAKDNAHKFKKRFPLILKKYMDRKDYFYIEITTVEGQTPIRVKIWADSMYLQSIEVEGMTYNFDVNYTDDIPIPRETKSECFIGFMNDYHSMGFGDMNGEYVSVMSLWKLLDKLRYFNKKDKKNGLMMGELIFYLCELPRFKAIGVYVLEGGVCPKHLAQLPSKWSSISSSILNHKDDLIGEVFETDKEKAKPLLAIEAFGISYVRDMVSFMGILLPTSFVVEKDKKKVSDGKRRR